MKQDLNEFGLTRKMILSVTLACTAVAMASSAFAQGYYDENPASGPYIGANYGAFKSRGGEFDDENDFFEFVAGYRFGSYVGIEGAYSNFGEYGTNAASADIDGWSIAAIGFLPLTDSFGVYAKVGQFFSDVRVHVGDFRDKFDDDQIFYGLGVSFVVADPLQITLEYNRYEVEFDDADWPAPLIDSDTDIDTIKVGVKFTF